MSDFISEQQCDELVDGQYYNGEYQPTEQDYRDMAEAWAEEMDGDHASGLASAGWGTDEDYGDYGSNFDF